MVRTYDRTHREAQARETRRAILDAALALLGEDDATPLTFARLAERAGVSEPTVYRNFANRETLLSALSDHVGTQLRSPGIPAKSEDLAASVLAATMYFEENPVIFRAALKTGGASSEVREVGRKRRVTQLREVLSQRTGHLQKKDAEAVQAIFATLVRSESWLEMTERAGIEGRRAGFAMAWAVRALLDALRRDEKRGVTTIVDEKLGEDAERMRRQIAEQDRRER